MQVVQRKSNDKVFHRQTGYWMWDAKAGIVMHSLEIPRAGAVMAGGTYNGATNDDGQAVVEVVSSADDGKMPYSQTTLVDIYGKKQFVHTDENELTRS